MPSTIASVVIVLTLVGIAVVLVTAKPLREHRHRDALRAIALTFFWGSLALALTLTLVRPGYGADGVNLVPGATLRNQIQNLTLDAALYNIGGNLILLAPVAFLAVLLFRWTWWKVGLAGFAASLVIEVAQFPLAGASDVDDVLVNCVGAKLGAMLAVLMRAAVTRLEAPPTRHVVESAE